MNHRICCGGEASFATILIAASMFFCAGCLQRDTPVAEVVRPVKTMVVTGGDESHIRIFPGKVEAARRVELAFRVNGLLVQLPVKEGDRVKEGELIAQLRQDEFAARLKTLQAQLDKARTDLRALRSGERPEERLRLEAQVRAASARLANARSEFDRAAQLLPIRAIAKSEYDRLKTLYDVAQEEFEAAREVLEQGTSAREEDIEAQEAVVRGLEGQVVEANIQLKDSTLHAPYDGVIAKRLVEQSQTVKAMQPIVRFQDVDELEIELDVPETVMVADLRLADIVQMLAEFSGAPGLEFPVQIREIAKAADPVTQTFRVRVGMKAPKNVSLLPGMTARVAVTYRRAGILGNRKLAPVSAVLQDTGREQAVWVIGPGETVSRRAVKVGEVTGGQIEITSGLEAGERIAIAGVTSLRDGMRVRDLGNALGDSSP